MNRNWKRMGTLLLSAFLLLGLWGCNGTPDISTVSQGETGYSQSGSAPSESAASESGPSGTGETTGMTEGATGNGSVTGGGITAGGTRNTAAASTNRPTAGGSHAATTGSSRPAGSTAATTRGATTTRPPAATDAGGEMAVTYEWHPGLPDRDASYVMSITVNGSVVNSSDISISCSTSGVRISANTVTIPYSVRRLGRDVTVTVASKSAGASCEVSIPCKAWEMTFNDEFNGTELDRSVWNEHNTPLTADVPSDAATYEVVDRAGQAKDCFTVGGGYLNMLIKDEPVYDTTNKIKYLYSECCLDTRNGFMQKYGCFMARVSVAEFGGINTAFWLLPNGAYSTRYTNFLQEDPNYGLAEIDILEASVAWDSEYCITEHYYNYNAGYLHRQRATYIPVENITDFHEYACVWQEDALYYYCDNELVRSTTDVQAESAGGQSVQRAYMILDIALYLNGSWVGDRDFDQSDLPISAEVDWVRAYQ